MKESGVFDVQHTNCPYCNEVFPCESNEFKFIKNIEDKKDLMKCTLCGEEFIIDYDDY